MRDTIYRDDAIKVIEQNDYRLQGCGTTYEIMLMQMREVPSADRPQGEWIDEGKNLWKCSNCEMVIYSESEQDRNKFHKWCSRCGARMKGADDELVQR